MRRGSGGCAPAAGVQPPTEDALKHLAQHAALLRFCIVDMCELHNEHLLCVALQEFRNLQQDWEEAAPIQGVADNPVCAIKACEHQWCGLQKM